MSIEAIRWALREAPGVPAQCLGVLIGLAEHADKHGRGAYPSAATLAGYSRKSERQVRYDLSLLSEAKLIRPGDQSEVAKYPANRRPVVYDLAVERRDEVQPAVCAYCGDLADTADHVIPTSRGGTDLPANRVPACGRCNSSKRDLTLEEWIATGRAPAGALAVQSASPQGLQSVAPRTRRGLQSTAPQRGLQPTAPQTPPELQEQHGVQSTAPQVSDSLGCNAAQPGVQSTAYKPSMNQSQKLKDGANTPPAFGDDSVLFAAEPSPNGSRKPAKRGPNPRQALADEVTNQWWERNKATTAQSYIAVRNIVRTAVVNGLEPEVVMKGLNHLAEHGTSVSGGTLQNALRDLGLLGKRTTGAAGKKTDYTDEEYTSGW